LLYPFFSPKKLIKNNKFPLQNSLTSVQKVFNPSNLFPDSTSFHSNPFGPGLHKKKFLEKVKLLSDLPIPLDHNLNRHRATLSFFFVDCNYFKSKKLTKLGDFHDGQLLEGSYVGTLESHSKIRYLSAYASLSDTLFEDSRYMKKEVFSKRYLKPSATSSYTHKHFNHPKY